MFSACKGFYLNRYTDAQMKHLTFCFNSLCQKQKGKSQRITKAILVIRKYYFDTIHSGGLINFLITAFKSCLIHLIMLIVNTSNAFGDKRWAVKSLIPLTFPISFKWFFYRRKIPFARPFKQEQVEGNEHRQGCLLIVSVCDNILS